MDYKKASQELEKPKVWFNPKEGSYKIKLLSELSEPYVQVFQNKDGTEEEREKVSISIEISGNQYTWSTATGKTKASLYGQLVLLGRNWESLIGKEITLVVKSDGKKRDFTIVEAAGLPQE